MGRKPRMVRIIVAAIAIVLFVFTIRPQYVFVARASQVKSLTDYSLAPNSRCGPGPGYIEPEINNSQNSETTNPVRPENRSKSTQPPGIQFNPGTEKGQPTPVDPGMSDPGNGDC